MSDNVGPEEIAEELLKCGVCDETFKFSAHEDMGRYRLKDHCFKCSSRARMVMMKEPDENVKSWFKSLRKEQPEEYKKIIMDAESKKASSSGPASRFNLATYKEQHEQSRGTKLKAGHELMTWPWYKARPE